VLTLEFKLLAASIALGLVQIVSASHAASLQRGYRWTASSRDTELPPLTGVAGRLSRALANFSETFPYFAVLVVACHFSGRTSALSEWGALLYFFGRLAYLPLYAFGVFLLRSLVWNVATGGIVLLLMSLIRG
jgi:uncharacterized MAPEG superfamily protein